MHTTPVPGTAGPPECAYCGAEIRFAALLPRGATPSCGSPRCRTLADQRASMNPDAFRFMVEINRRLAARLRENDRRAAAKQVAEAREHELIWDALARRRPALTPPRYARMLLPTGPQRMSRLPARRRELYRQHLLQIIEQAVSGAAGDGSQPPAAPAPVAEVRLGATLCGVCRGGCCPIGGEEAFLTADTMRRVMRDRTELGPGDLLAAYLAHLPERSATGSCVNQTARGCSLPREMRSDVCNRYYCPALREWQAAQEADPPPEAVIVIQRRQNHWRRDDPNLPNDVVGVHVVSERGTRKLRVRTL